MNKKVSLFILEDQEQLTQIQQDEVSKLLLTMVAGLDNDNCC